MCCCCGCFCMGHAKQRGPEFGSNDNFSTPGTTSDNSPVWEKYEWDRIPNQFKEHWMVMGWDEAMWNAGGKASTDNMSWSELSKDQQNSATALGYTQDRWDNSIPITVILTLYNVAPHYLFFQKVIELLVSKQSALTKQIQTCRVRWCREVGCDSWSCERGPSISYIHSQIFTCNLSSKVVHKCATERYGVWEALYYGWKRTPPFQRV